MSRHRLFVVSAGVALCAASALSYALEGSNGSTVVQLFSVADLKAHVTYDASFAGAPWQSLSSVVLWAPEGQGQRDAIAGDGAGCVYVLVAGAASTGSGAQYTGLVRYDGSSFLHLVQDVMDSPDIGDQVGTSLQAVTVSPTSAGSLTAGHPVVLRQVNTSVGGAVQGELDVVSVDPGSGAETLVHTFGVNAIGARLAIDGSGSSTDGTLYVGPMQDGTIARLAYAGSGYDASTVGTTLDAAHGLRIDSDGRLYTFASDVSWTTLASPFDDQAIQRLDPATGTATAYAWVDGESFIFSWAVGADDRLWMGLRRASGKGKKQSLVRYVTEAVAGTTAGLTGRITDSGDDSMSLAAAPNGDVLERPFSSDGAVYIVSPGSGGDGSGSGGGKGRGKKG